MAAEPGRAREAGRRGCARGARVAPGPRGQGPARRRRGRDARGDDGRPAEREGVRPAPRGDGGRRAPPRARGRAEPRGGDAPARGDPAPRPPPRPRRCASSTTRDSSVRRGSRSCSPRSRRERRGPKSKAAKAPHLSRVTYQAPRQAVISRMESVRVRPSTTKVRRGVLHCPEGLLPAVALRGHLGERPCPSSSDTNWARSRPCALCESRWTALRKGTVDPLLPLLAGVLGVSRGEPAVPREDDVRRRGSASSLPMASRRCRARVGELVARSWAGSRRRAGAASSADHVARPPRRRQRRPAARRARRPPAEPPPAIPREDGTSRAPAKGRSPSPLQPPTEPAHPRTVVQASIGSVTRSTCKTSLERLDLGEACLGGPREQAQLRARSDAALEDGVRDLLDVDAVPLEHREHVRERAHLVHHPDDELEPRGRRRRHVDDVRHGPLEQEGADDRARSRSRSTSCA